MAARKTYRLSDAAFERFQELKKLEDEAAAEKDRVMKEQDRRITVARDHTASFLNGVAAQLGVPPKYLFIEEYGEFRENRKRPVAKKAPASKRRRSSP